MPQPEPTVRALDHLVLTVASIPKTVAFYDRAIGMQPEQFKVTNGTTRWALRFGHSKINLHEVGKEFDPKAQHPTAGSADLCFLTDAALDHWVSRLTAQGIPIEEGPVARTGAEKALTSIYIRDPDQNLIEIAVET